jgi:hypothetical protein
VRHDSANPSNEQLLALQSRSARCLSFVILVFPALDVLSAFPLSAITLGNNLRSALEGKLFGKAADDDLAEEEDPGVAVAAPDGDGPGRERGLGLSHSRRSLLDDLTSAEEDEEEEAPVLTRRRRRLGARLLRRLPAQHRGRARAVFFRLLACVPPVFAAALSTWAGVDLGTIFRVIGTLGVAIALAIPSLLRLYSAARHESVLRWLVDAVGEVQDSQAALSLSQAQRRASALVAEAMRQPLPLAALLRGVHHRDGWAVETPYTAAPLRLLRRLHPAAASLDVAVLGFSAFAALFLVVVLAGGV